MTPVYGLQQVGLGVENVEEVAGWYAHHLGFTVRGFDDSEDAVHMAPFMGGSVQPKRALLHLHPNGGGGLEIWQFTARKPLPCTHSSWGQPGINAVGIGCKSPTDKFTELLANGAQAPHFDVGGDSPVLMDPWGNMLVLEQAEVSTGIQTVYLGCRDVTSTRSFLEQTGLLRFEGTTGRAAHPSPGKFAAHFGAFAIELLKSNTPDKHTYEGRWWGDCGWMHWCLDVGRIDQLSEHCAHQGNPFSVLVTDPFQMGEAHGHWGYLQDPEGTLLECVETLSIPLLPKWGWNLAFDRDQPKPIPKWMLGVFIRKNRVRPR